MKTALRNTTWTQRLLAALFLIGGYAAGGWILLVISAAVIALLVKPLGPAWSRGHGTDDGGVADDEIDFLNPATPGYTLSETFDE